MEVVKIMETDASYGMENALKQIQPRPWLIDGLDVWLDRIEVINIFHRSVDKNTNHNHCHCRDRLTNAPWSLWTTAERISYWASCHSPVNYWYVAPKSFFAPTKNHQSTISHRQNWRRCLSDAVNNAPSFKRRTIWNSCWSFAVVRPACAWIWGIYRQVITFISWITVDIDVILTGCFFDRTYGCYRYTPGGLAGHRGNGSCLTHQSQCQIQSRNIKISRGQKQMVGESSRRRHIFRDL